MRFHAISDGRCVGQVKLPPPELSDAQGFAIINQRPGEAPPLLVIYDGDCGCMVNVAVAVSRRIAELLDQGLQEGMRMRRCEHGN